MVYVAEVVNYYAIHLDHHTETWGGNTYNKILTKDAPNINLVTTGSTSVNAAIDFLYPLLLGEFSIDGVAEGWFTLYCFHASGSTIAGFTISLLALPETGSVRTLASVTESYSPAISMIDNEYLTLPIIMNISKQEVSANEKLILRFEISGGTNRVALSHEVEPDVEGNMDIMFKLPYAPEE